MENASRALIMIGSILIAILILALLVKSVTGIGKFKMSQLTQEAQEQLTAFNEQYTKYLGQYVYGTEVISVINKSLNNRDYTITTKIKFANNGSGYSYEGYVYNPTKKRYEKSSITIKKGTTLTIINDADNNSTVNNFINSLGEADSINTMAFKCTKVTYDNLGRVNGITFEEKQWGDLY